MSSVVLATGFTPRCCGATGSVSLGKRPYSLSVRPLERASASHGDVVVFAAGEVMHCMCEPVFGDDLQVDLDRGTDRRLRALNLRPSVGH